MRAPKRSPHSRLLLRSYLSMRTALVAGTRPNRRMARARMAARPPKRNRSSPPPVWGSCGAPAGVPGAPAVTEAALKSDADSTEAIDTLAGDVRALVARFSEAARSFIRPDTAG